MKKLLFGMAFFATMAFSGAVQQAQAAGDDAIAPKPCYTRMVICGGGYNAYHCDAQPTGTQCGTYDKDCFFCLTLRYVGKVG